MKTPCGREENFSGKPYTESGVRDHVKNCRHPLCVREKISSRPLSRKRLQDVDDEPDGAYFALRYELEER